MEGYYDLQMTLSSAVTGETMTGLQEAVKEPGKQKGWSQGRK